jgi:hypothetical protein
MASTLPYRCMLWLLSASVGHDSMIADSMSCLTELSAWLGTKMIPPALVAEPWLNWDAYVMLPRRIKSGLACRAQTAGASPSKIARINDISRSHSCFSMHACCAPPRM